MEAKDFRASLRIIHPSCQAQEIVEAVPMVASVIHSVGQLRINRKGIPLGGTYDSSYVSFKLDIPADWSIVALINKILMELAPVQDRLEHLVLTGGELQLYVSIFIASNSGFTLTDQLLGELASKRVTLCFDLYPDSDSVANKD